MPSLAYWEKAAGLPGLPVNLLYMVSTHPVHVIRATTMLFLLFFDVALLGIVAVQSLLSHQRILLGVLFGTWPFRPRYEKVYRTVAYSIIGLSALSGLPIWG